MTRHPHRPDWQALLIDTAIFAAIFTALDTALRLLESTDALGVDL